MPRIARPAANLTAPVLSGSPVVGGTLTITPGTWSRTTTVLYTLLRAGMPVIGCIKVSKATFEARTLVEADIGPALAVREHSLAGGGYADSAPVSTAFSMVATNLMAWDASSLSTTPVTSWVDVIASVAASQATPTKQPAWSATSPLNSKPGVTFDGDDVLVATGAGPVLSGKTVCTITGVAVDTDTAVKVMIELTTNFVTQNGGIAVFTNDVGAGRFSGGARGITGATNVYTTGVGTDLAAPVVFSIGFDLSVAGAGAVVFIRINGVSRPLTTTTSASVAGTLANASLHIGGRGTTPTLGALMTLGCFVMRESAAQDNSLITNERLCAFRGAVTY